MNAAGTTSLPPRGPESRPGSFGVADTLTDLPIVAEDAGALATVRLGAAVAAALRAALDWLTAAPGIVRPLRARADDAALEIVIERIDGRWLSAAGEALAAVGGSVGRVESARPAAPWVVRVPVQAERDQFLMVVENGVPIALPWPAVLHIVMARTDEIESGLAAPRVPSPVQAAPAEARARVAEVPVVLLGLGLKRGYFVADRLVWKFPAAVIETMSPPPAAGLTHAVQTDEGDGY
ncbi:MAG TPA: hypothetical protein VI792_12095, partial [Candidatus Eisenbacteria bacterium]